MRHLEIEIGSVEASGDPKRVPQRKELFDIGFYMGRGGGGKRARSRTFRQAADKFRNAQIARTEVLPPLGNAVRLVNGHQRNFRTPRKAQKIAGCQPLWCDIDDFIGTCLCTAKHLAVLRDGQGRVDVG